MTARTNAAKWVPVPLALTALLAAGCAAQEDNDQKSAASSPSAAPHGYVEGAKEGAEQQSRLVLNDPDSGSTRVLDLITGKVTKTDKVTGAADLATDGRFGYLHASGTTHVLDGGSWTVDHGDHVHYYRAAIRDVGELPVGEGALVRSGAAVTAVTDKGGRTVLYDRGKLEKGGIARTGTLPGTANGPVVPYEEHLLALTGKGDAAKLTVFDRKGKRVAAPDTECEEPKGDAVTRRGVVFGCAGGALLVREESGKFTAESIPYEKGVPDGERAAEFRQRPGSDTLTARAGDDAVWVLDVGERAWTRVETGPVVAANTAGEGAPLLVLETDGRLHGYDIKTGEETTRTKKLLTGKSHTRNAPVVEVDRSRAYVNDPDGKRVFEVDYNDDLRIARTFDLDVEPVLMAETGR
ncbi:PQQ-binding-like beta-propeller repeat protein [Streptomyces sp. UC4497]